MGCNCGKNKKVAAAAVPSIPGTAPRATVTYDVTGKDGAIIASTTNVVFARSEARRSGGTYKPRVEAKTS